MERSEQIEQRRAVVARLTHLRESGRLSSRTVKLAAASLGTSERSLYRWLSEGQYAPGKRDRWTLTRDAVRALYAVGGRPKVAWQMLGDASVEVPSWTTFQRAVNADLSEQERAYMREGEAGKRRYSVYRRWEPEERNDVWEADHALLDVLVTVPRWRDPVKPWLTVLIDGYSRVIMGWVISIQPTTAEVLTAIREGIVIDSERGPWGGVPDLIVFDGGREFLADAVGQASARLGLAALPTPPYSPEKKGKVERLHRTIRDGLIAGLPHYTHGPRKASGQLYAQPAQLTIGDLQAATREYVDNYNRAHKHGSLGGLTPAQQWETSTRPLEIVPQEHMRWMLLADTSRKINKDGIHFQGTTYIAPEILGLGGETIEVRYMPHDSRSIEVFHDRDWLCTAYPQDRVSNELADALRAQQQKLNRGMGGRRAAASRERNGRLAPVTASGPIEELPRRPGRKKRPPELSDARIDHTLRQLGFGDELNTALAPKPEPDA